MTEVIFKRGMIKLPSVGAKVLVDEFVEAPKDDAFWGLNSKQTKEYMKLVLQEGTESKIKALLKDSGMNERRIGFLLEASWAVTRDE